MTPPSVRRENRSFATSVIGYRTRVVGASLAALWFASSPARAEESAVACALEQAGLARAPDLASRWSVAALAPKLAVGLRGGELALPGLAARSVEVFAWVRWPLERRRAGALSQLGALASRRQQLAEDAAARARALQQIRLRPRSTELRAQIDDQLDEEEARAGLAAIGGCP